MPNLPRRLWLLVINLHERFFTLPIRARYYLRRGFGVMFELTGIERGTREENVDLPNLERTSNASNEANAKTIAEKSGSESNEQAPPRYDGPPSYEYVLWSERLQTAQLRPQTPATKDMYEDMIRVPWYPIDTQSMALSRCLI